MRQSCCRGLLLTALFTLATIAAAQESTGQAMKPPTDGYTVHVLAPHVVNGKVMGPYHHYCKSMSDNPPQIVCQIYESTDAGAWLMQVEYIFSKSLTRPNVALKDWNKNWHDHAQEIATGRVKVLDMPEDEAKKVADMVSTTDGLIVHIELDDKHLPTGRLSIAQSVGHRNLTPAEYKSSASAAGAKSSGASQ